MLRQLEKLAKRATAAADDVPGFFVLPLILLQSNKQVAQLHNKLINNEIEIICDPLDYSMTR